MRPIGIICIIGLVVSIVLNCIVDIMRDRRIRQLSDRLNRIEMIMDARDKRGQLK